MIEADICKMAVEKLRSEGWAVKCEVAMHGQPMDAVAMRGEDVLILEAKLSFSKRLKHQVYHSIAYSDFGLAVVSTKPAAKTLEWCEKNRIGVWRVNGAIAELLPIQRLNLYAPWMKAKLVESFRLAADGIDGGHPCRAGIGPAIDVQRRVDEYRALHPKATWREIHANVPSHYNTASNMYSSLRSNAERIAYRNRMKELRSEVSEVFAK